MIARDNRHGLANNATLKNRHTGEITGVKDMEQDGAGVWWVTLYANQAPGRPIDVGYRVDALLKDWEHLA